MAFWTNSRLFFFVDAGLPSVVAAIAGVVLCDILPRLKVVGFL
jgi:hypothetical protein